MVQCTAGENNDSCYQNPRISHGLNGLHSGSTAHIRSCPCPGFSLIELILVVGIVAIVSGIAFPTYSSYREKVDSQKAAADLAGMVILIEKFYAENNRYPNSLNEIGKGGLKDPWDREYQYQNNSLIMENEIKSNNKPNYKPTCTGCRKDGPIHPINTDFDLFSIGKDGKSVSSIRAEPSHDDIVRAFNGSYIGTVRDMI